EKNPFVVTDPFAREDLIFNRRQAALFFWIQRHDPFLHSEIRPVDSSGFPREKRRNRPRKNRSGENPAIGIKSRRHASITHLSPARFSRTFVFRQSPVRSGGVCRFGLGVHSPGTRRLGTDFMPGS